ncbi:armadillo-type protein [Irpex rosettiformis]|uniref:Armadillo-type protein n=1 Tax=Irpex rosettiformis TaxID=378272 RepID=A0ACB8UDI6_9APHY|nr:armadillo-type protein [Irpex rosettiformis]
MTSSLAKQLAQGVSLNASLLVDRSRRLPTQSYLFTPREADQHDLDSIHALGVNGFQRLKAIEPTIFKYEDALFSDAAKATDRTLLTSEGNANLDISINGLLSLLGPYLLEAPASKVVEWLVRRFRVNEFNVEVLLGVFLPYHESPHFKKMLSILHIKEQSKVAALLPYKTTSSSLTLSALVDIMTKPDNSDFARFSGSLLPSAVSVGPSALHRTLIAFHTGVLLEFLKRSSQTSKTRSLTEGTLAWVLSSAVNPLQEWSRVEVKKQALVVEVVLSSYLLLSAISHTCPLSPEALTTILKAVASCARLVSTTQVLRTLGSICAAQTSVPDDAVSKNVVKVVLSLGGVDQELKELLKYSGTEKFVLPFIKNLLERLDNERATSVLTSLVTYAEVPRAVILAMASGLIDLSLHSSESDSGTIQARARSLLVHLHQRHPQVLHKAFQVALADEEDHNAAQQLLLSLSVQLPEGSKTAEVGEEDLVLATISADANIRASAVRGLYERMGSGNFTGLDADGIRSALLARLQDTNTSVIEALYSNPVELLPILRADAAAYVTHVAQVLNSLSPAPTKAIVRAHLSFIATHFYPTIAELPGYADVKTLVVQQAFFPQLLFSKPRQKSAALVWEIIQASEKEPIARSLSHHELFGDCVEAVRWEESKTSGEQTDGSYEATQTMANVNIALAAKIADNILSSPSSESYLKFLLTQIRSNNAHSKSLAYLVCRALLTRLSDQRRVEVAYDILQATELTTLDGVDDFLRGTDDVQVFLHDLSLSTAVVLKPTKRHTLHRLQVALLVAMASVPRPTGAMIDWLSPILTESSAQGHTLTFAERYVANARSLYMLANSTTSLPAISRHIIRILVGSLGDDALKFLAGIWLNGANGVDSTTRYASLRHASAYLEAHFSTQRFVDFQVIVPALLVALADGDSRVREAGLDCVTVLFRLSQAKKPVSVYAFDEIYGPGSTHLQYLDWPDFCRYIQALQQSRQHLLNDASYLTLLHQQLLVAVKSDGKKEAGFKQRALCYLLSHVSASSLPVIHLAVLRSTQGISSPVKFRTLLPAIEVAVSGNAHVDDELLALLFASADETIAASLNDTTQSSWETYMKVIRYVFRQGGSSTARSTVSHALSTGLFIKLQLDRKVELCKTLLELAQQGPENATACKTLLAILVAETAVINHLLLILQPSGRDESQRAAKRARVESGDSHDYSSLTTLAEVLGAKPLPGSSELVSTLLDTLSKTINDGSVASADKAYLEQLLLSAIDNVVTNISVENGNTLRAIRLDTLVELIRVSENPQTFNQALLLVASLAKLVPEAVLQTVMPVFTFMGSNVLHRDDSYSFNVVRKTIDSIVPVMTASLKCSHLEKLDLHIASRPFIRIFTDAYNHIPRHRRISFFAHLIEVLGPSDFLSAVCLLLVDKMSNRVVRQSAEEIATSLSLPLSLLARFDANVQFTAFVDMLQESSRLLESDLQLTSSQKIFLEPSPLDDERGSSSHLPRRQAQAVVTFVSLGLRQIISAPSSGSGTTGIILSLLLDIAVAKKEALVRASMDQLANIARDAISDVLRVMSAKDFVLGVLTVVESGQSEIQKAAFEVLAEQLDNISEKVRQELRPTIVKLVENIKKLLPSARESLLQAVLNALAALITTLSAGEEHSLTSTVPLIIGVVQQRRTTPLALRVLSTLVQKLGPRIIPFFKDIVKECADVLREEDLQSQAEAINVLHALLTTIPSFWSGGDFLLIVELYLKQHEAGSQNQLSTFVKTLAKRAPTKVLLPTMCDLWTRLAANHPESQQISGYLFVLRRTIQHTDRAALPEYLRTLFKMFVEIFQLCASSTDVRLTVESDAIVAFVEMVVKLNEATFKPLFRKLFDWAFTGSDATEGRKLVLLHVYDALLDYFKSLMTPYMVFLLPPLIDLLNGFKETSVDSALWSAVIQTLQKSCSHDEGAFWREDKLRQLIAPVVTQIPVGCSTNSPELRDSLRDCVVSLADVMNDPSSLKSLNLDVLMHTRSDDARVRIYALACSEALWQAHGGKLIGYAPETATFVAECAEDDNDSVVRAAHRLKNTVESIAGRIDV